MQPITKTKTNRRGDVITTMTYLFSERERPVISEEVAFNQESTAMDTARSILATIPPDENCKIQIVLGKGGFGLNGMATFEDSIDEAISIPEMPFVSRDEVLDELEESINTVMQRYDDPSHLIVNDLKVVIITPNPENGAAGGKRHPMATKTWLIPGEYNTQENCFYYAWGMCNDPVRFANEYLEWLTGKRSTYPDFKNYAKKKKNDLKRSAEKSGMDFRLSYVDDAQTKFIADHSKPRPIVRIYDGQFLLLREWKPDTVTMQTPVFEIQRSQNHYRPMIRWSDLDPTMHQRIEKALVAKDQTKPEIDKARKIRETFKAKETRNRRFVAWDLETSTDDSTLGLVWKACNQEDGILITNTELSSAIAAGKKTFTPEERETMQIEGLAWGAIVQLCGELLLGTQRRQIRRSTHAARGSL